MLSCLSWLIALAVFLSDQLAKKYISKSLSLGRSIPVIKNVFHLTLVHNSGVAFGLFKNQQALFIIITSIVILYIALALFLMVQESIPGRAQVKHFPIPLRKSLKVIVGGDFLDRKQNSVNSRIAFGLILGGACGNLLDRLRLGFIIDFFDFRIWPVFNIADSAISVGIILLAYSIIKKPVTSNQ